MSGDASGREMAPSPGALFTALVLACYLPSGPCYLYFGIAIGERDREEMIRGSARRRAAKVLLVRGPPP